MTHLCLDPEMLSVQRLASGPRCRDTTMDTRVTAGAVT